MAEIDLEDMEKYKSIIKEVAYRRGHIGTDLWASKEHICQGTDILINFLLRIKHTFPDWSREQQLKGGIAAYNAGDGNIDSYETVDSKTSNGDFSNDVIARAQWYRTTVAFNP
ncbi:hypothetical protein F7725_005646 [Dissostichus mawsoni]|uniref:Lysozyme g n=1 Tax=Dissostichus mawsoni TaxID=36200 RepID=A0A7J5YTV5_DISMA|nr:hypothetical protein F7725_005646 [Dissostichus mawsoni]